MKLITLFLAILVKNVAGQFQRTCPPQETINSCKCALGEDGLPWITCGGFTSLSRFQKSMGALKGYSISTLYIENSDLDSIPANIFDGAEIRSMKIISVNLTKIGDSKNRPPFLGLENTLEDFEITESFTDEKFPMKSFSLAHLKKLTIFESNKNIVPNIPNDWFDSGPYGLNQVWFENSLTKKIGSHAFSSLVNLKQISVTGGTISEVTRAMFPKPAPHLIAIDLSNNALSALPADLFRYMPSLEEVYLENNAFAEIGELVWSTVWSQVNHVYFQGNPINCNDQIKWIYKYRLPEVLRGNCTEPASLRGKELQKLTLKDFKVNS